MACCRVNTALAQTPAVDVDRPNVIVIYTDDQGSLDVNCYGSKDLQTPHLDALAKRGLRFTKMYSPSAICSASRAGMLTGRFPARAGVPGNVSSAEGVAGMPTSEVTMAELLKSAGYATGHVGKWHLGYTKETMPNQQGFDFFYGYRSHGHAHYHYWDEMYRNNEVEVIEGKDLSSKKLYKAMKASANRAYKTKLDKNVKGLLKLLNEFNKINNARKVVDDKIARLGDEISKSEEKKLAKELEELNEAQKEAEALRDKLYTFELKPLKA